LIQVNVSPAIFSGRILWELSSKTIRTSQESKPGKSAPAVDHDQHFDFHQFAVAD
jgi:hypothetical protein